MWIMSTRRPSGALYTYHQLLWTFIPERYRAPGAARAFVYRVEDDRLLMLSRYRPECEALAVSPGILNGQVYQFTLRCSPVRGTQRGSGSVTKRRDPYPASERKEWLARRLDGAAQVLFATSRDRPDLTLQAPGGRRVRWSECDISGTVRVLDRTELIGRMCQGIGGRGAWGHGLLWLPEVMG